MIGKQFKWGDLIARIARFLRIPHCDECERRRVILNDLQAAGVKETLRKLKDCCN
ncbi:MAG: hypothetical protein HYS26_01840 [Candidatus Kaiserbacteria bacterium]|nr:MAG: hypothetical protein HYS26_01840 [Candidatus Kaiserbacteria bacterium]